MTLLREFEQYTLLGEIAEGGMGIIFQAVHRGLNRSCALKLIRSGLLATPDERRRFVTEAEAAAKLDHPGIVRVGRAAEFEGQWFLEMELVEGGTLADRVAEGPLAPKEAARLVERLACAVQHAHERGILHRDLKPANVLLGPEDEPKLTDFGLARFLEKGSDLTHTIAVLGTPAYLAPELASGRAREATIAADVYSLGVILFECLTGQRPFQGQTTLEILRAVQDSVTPCPSSRRRDLPRDLDVITLRCMEKDPNRRYPSAGALAQDLERWLRYEPILARPSGLWERSAKWIRRHPVATIEFVAALVVLGVLVYAQVQVNRRGLLASQQRERALTALADLGFLATDASFNAGETPKAIAYLARTLRQDPNNGWAAQRLMSALTYRNFPLPTFVPLRHGAPVNSAQFSPDGARILTASQDGTARIWDARTGQLVAPVLRHPGAVRSARFDAGGRSVITASDDGFVRVWDAERAQLTAQSLAHSNEVRSAEFSPDGTKILSAAGRRVRVWEARTGAPISEWLHHDSTDRLVRSMQFSPDGSRVLTADGDSARLWSWSKDGSTRPEKVDTKWMQFARFSPDGGRVVVGSGEDVARIWKLKGTNSPIVLRGHGGDVDQVEFSPDGGRVVTASKDRTARVWDAYTGDPLFAPLMHEGRVWLAQFSADGLRLLTVAEDRTVRVWDAETGELVCEPIRHELAVSAAEFSPDGQLVVTACVDGAARMWDVRRGAALGESSWSYFGNPDQSDPIRRSSQIVQLTNLFPRETLNTLVKGEPISASAHLGPEGRWLLIRDAEGLVHLHDEESGAVVSAPFRHDEPMRNIAVSGDRKLFATVTPEHKLRVWEASSGRTLHDTAEHVGALIDPVFSPNGQRLLVTPDSIALRVWGSATGRAATEVFAHHKKSVLCARFSPDGQSLVTGSYDNTAIVCDAQTGQLKLPPLQHDGFVRCVDFSPNGEWLVTVSVDRFLRIWEVRTGRPLAEPMPHRSEVRWACFSPDGRQVASFATDGTARIWETSSGHAVTDSLRHSFGYDLPVWLGRFNAEGTQLITYPRPYLKQIWELARAPVPAPEWLPELAEALASRRLNERRISERVLDEEFFRWRSVLVSLPPTNFYSRWAGWFFADRLTRALGPASSVTLPEYVRRQAREGHWPLMRDTTREAVRLAPTNGLALLRLARAKTRQAFESRDARSQRLRDEADFFTARALRFDPSEREAWLGRAEFLNNAGRKEDLLLVVEAASKRFPEDDAIRRLKEKFDSRVP